MSFHFANMSVNYWGMHPVARVSNNIYIWKPLIGAETCSVRSAQ
jgi:hypothetical protein